VLLPRAQCVVYKRVTCYHRNSGCRNGDSAREKGRRRAREGDRKGRGVGGRKERGRDLPDQCQTAFYAPAVDTMLKIGAYKYRS